MSRFFAASDSDTESSSSEDEIQISKPQTTRAMAAWSSDDEDTKRVVRSEKDKRYEELRDTIKLIKNHKKIKDMSKVLSDFEDLTKAYDKAKKVVVAEGIPKFYLAMLVELDGFINECWEDRDGRKAMSKANAKGLTTLRQKFRKYTRDFEDEMTAFREKPEVEDEEEEPEEQAADSDDDIDDPAAFKKAATPDKKASASKFLKDDDDDEDDDDFWPSDSESSSSDDEGGYGGTLTADYFLKKTKHEDDEERIRKKREKEEKEKQKRQEKERRRREEEEEAAEDDGWTKVKGGSQAIQQKAKLFPDDAEIKIDLILKKLHEIVAGRGKKGTDRNEQIDNLIELRNISNLHNLGAAVELKILFSTVSAIFDYNPNIATCMKSEMWEKALNYTETLLDVLIKNKGDIFVGMNIADDSETFEGDGPLRVRGCILSMIERMDEEFVKMLQACDAHSTEYVERLKDEQKVCEIILKLQGYLETFATTEEICRVYLKRIEHIYYKFDQKSRIAGQPDTSAVDMDKLCKYIYEKDNTDRIRTRAILCHIYHHALHDRWFEARDLMLMSHLQESIQHSDIPTQIMYNRAMVQLGLCAFRQNMIKDAHNCLVDIQSSGRAKELLAQGLLLQRQHERTPEQEKMEKRRQMPYHMHINLELLECVYLVSAMLIEIPYMAAHEFDARRRMISKNFHHVMRVSDRQPLVGPPESMREHVVAASKAMKTGDWRQVKDYIINDKMNAKVWDLFYEGTRIRELLIANIKEESLRTYLFTYSSVYDSISMDTLADMFELKKSLVHSTISKMIINEELMASLDEPSQCVMMHRTEPSRLQALSLQLSEKVSSLVDFNDRMMEAKQGGGFFSYQRGGQQDGQQGGYQRQGQDGGRQYGDKRNRGDGEGGRGRGGKDYRGRGGGRGGGGRQNYYQQNYSDNYNRQSNRYRE